MNSSTKLICKSCDSYLDLHRTCLDVRLFCRQCRRYYEIEDYIQEMDEDLEMLLANIHCNRI